MVLGRLAGTAERGHRASRRVAALRLGPEVSHLLGHLDSGQTQGPGRVAVARPHPQSTETGLGQGLGPLESAVIPAEGETRFEGERGGVRVAQRLVDQAQLHQGHRLGPAM